MAKKRKLNQEQVTLLELNFGNEHKLESDRKDRIASEVGLDPRQVAVWFQNRRARWKNKKLEEEYSRLKSLHEIVVLDKCRLESEVCKYTYIFYSPNENHFNSQKKKLQSGLNHTSEFIWMFKCKPFVFLLF